MALRTIENQYLEQLRKAKEDEKLSFFIGSGFSTSKDPSKYGGWKSIIDLLKKDLSKELQAEQDNLRIAQIYESIKGRKQLLSVVKNAFPRIDEVDELHETLIRCNIQNIITTNWDCLIETAAKKNLAIYDTIANDSELLKSVHQNKIIKIHGDFSHRNIIFSEQDYLNYSDKFPIIENYVKNIVATNTVILLGYSFNDLDLKQLVNWVINKGSVRPSIYMITIEKKSKDEISYFEKSFGIKIIQICEDKTESKSAFINFFKCLDYDKYIKELESPESYVYRYLKQYEKYPVILRRFIQKSLTNCSFVYSSEQESILELNQKIITFDMDNEKRQVLQNFYNSIPILIIQKDKTLNKIIKILTKADIHGIATDTDLFERKPYISFSRKSGNKDFYNDNFNFSYVVNDGSSIKTKMKTVFSLNALERFEEAYILNKELLSETRFKEDFSNYFIALLNNNVILFSLKYSLKCGIDINNKYKDVPEISIQNEFMKLSSVQKKQVNQVFEYSSLITINSCLTRTRDELKKIREKKSIIAKGGVAYSAESGHRTNHKNFVDFVVNTGICVENNSEYIECCHNYISMFFENTLSTSYTPNKTELYSLIRYYSNEELQQLLDAFAKKGSVYQLIISQQLQNWLIDQVLLNTIENYINKNNPFTELEKSIENTLFLLSLIKNNKNKTEKILNLIKRVIFNARNSETIFSVIDLFFVNQYILYKGTYLKGNPGLEVFESLINKLVDDKCNMHEIQALLSYKLINVCNIGIQKSVKFSNEKLLKKLLKIISEVSEQKTKYNYIEKIVMIIYQMSNEPCKALIKDFIINLEISKDKTSFDYISFMLTIKNLKFDLDDQELKNDIRNHINSFPKNTFSSSYLGLKSCLDAVCEKDSSYHELAEEVETIIQKYNKEEFHLPTGETKNA
ncbi:MAG: SIR2 family protein [Spirochaetia bacterium]|nr:SIR2 family protein [Spirochaetia bacterium]